MLGESSKADDIVFRAKNATAIFSQYTQGEVDNIVRAVYQAVFNERVRLAKMAVEETGIGKWQDKVMKNVVASQLVYEDIKNVKTVGIINEDFAKGIIEIAQPLGPIFAIIPVTNPTSTIIYKILISLKTRNPIIIHPHRLAVNCSIETARICYEAALAADAPEDCIQWVKGFGREDTQALMSNPDIALILATGGTSLVKAAYSSGTPAIGVGAGNVPVFIENSADIDFAVDNILSSKLFDNGTVCASEQSIVVESAIAGKIRQKLIDSKAYFLNPEEIEKVQKVAYDVEKDVMKVDVVGQSVKVIAGLAGINVPDDTSLLVAPLDIVGKEAPLSNEILAPIIAFYVEKDFEHAVKRCIDLNFHGGVGHTASIFSNDDEIIKKFSLIMNAGRIVVNMPSSQGAVGLGSGLSPSLTLGCGTGGKNITTDNITAVHLLNIQRIARRRSNELYDKFDKSKYLDENYNLKDLEIEFYKNK
jgi:acetaldehyde dehydrogenase/alcohol dehydrogenase